MKLASRDMRVSVVIPCLNEEEPIADVVREVLAQGVVHFLEHIPGDRKRIGKIAPHADSLRPLPWKHERTRHQRIILCSPSRRRMCYRSPKFCQGRS